MAHWRTICYIRATRSRACTRPRWKATSVTSTSRAGGAGWCWTTVPRCPGAYGCCAGRGGRGRGSSSRSRRAATARCDATPRLSAIPCAGSAASPSARCGLATSRPGTAVPCGRRSSPTSIACAGRGLHLYCGGFRDSWAQGASMNLDDWRSRINDLDNQILNLLNQRADAALHIGELKRQQDLPYFVPEREVQVLDRLIAQNRGPLPPEALRVIWREILSASLALENPLPVVYLGPAATYTHQAAQVRFGSSALLRPTRSIAEVFDEVERGRAEYGVVPVENSTEGPVNVTLDRLIDSDALITGEVTLEISHFLLSRAGDVSEVKKVCSHPQGLAQCRQWLNANLPDVPTEETSSTAAAISSEMAGRLYDVPVLRRRIEDNPFNSTRFLVLGRRPIPATGRDKTSILFSMKNEPGVLYSILHPFAERGFNLTKI